MPARGVRGVDVANNYKLGIQEIKQSFPVLSSSPHIPQMEEPQGIVAPTTDAGKITEPKTPQLTLPDLRTTSFGDLFAAMPGIQKAWQQRIANSTTALNQRRQAATDAALKAGQDQNLAQNYTHFANTAAAGGDKTKARQIAQSKGYTHA
jgi:hypothetical protein